MLTDRITPKGGSLRKPDSIHEVIRNLPGVRHSAGLLAYGSSYLSGLPVPSRRSAVFLKY